jgi:hypothetical protein
MFADIHSYVQLRQVGDPGACVCRLTGGKARLLGRACGEPRHTESSEPACTKDDAPSLPVQSLKEGPYGPPIGPVDVGVPDWQPGIGSYAW